uniref:Fibronectin type-III domain-containing protein n=1 Tax=Biomphalaria glabrata TaxID=6526 RepID=A0A2C9LPI2_BIOGL
MILLFSMLSLKVFSVHSSASIIDCESGRKTAEYLEGQTFSLCCSLDLECNRTQWTDYLGIKKRNSHSEHPSRFAVNRTDRCVVRYSVISAVTEDTGIYACYRNDDNYIFDNMDVTIIEKPRGLTIQSITCSDLKDLNITFSYRNVNPTFDQVQVTLEEQGQFSLLNSYLVNVCRLCSYWTYTIVPSPVQDLSIFNISSTEVILKFRPTFETKNLIHWMFERGKVLTYHVTLFSTSPMEKWKIQFNKTVLFDGKSSEFTAVWFQDLIPFTQYTLIVCCSGGGGQGQSRELTFITNQSVPLDPPEVDNFSYMRWYDMSRVKSSCVFIIIKPLHRTSSDRKDVSFKAELTTHSEDLPIKKCYSICQLCQVPRDSFSVRLWTLNRIGQSKTYTEITIPTS